MASFRSRPLYQGGEGKNATVQDRQFQQRQVEIMFRKKTEINTRIKIQGQRMDELKKMELGRAREGKK